MIDRSVVEGGGFAFQNDQEMQRMKYLLPAAVAPLVRGDDLESAKTTAGKMMSKKLIAGSQSGRQPRAEHQAVMKEHSGVSVAFWL